MANPFLSCVHTHTHFCDGKDAPEVFVKKALELGYVSLGFSGHAPTYWDEAAMSKESLQQYIAEIQRLQQTYDGQIEILLGIEWGKLSDRDNFPYDYSIESVHGFKVGERLCFVDWSWEKVLPGIEEVFGGDVYAYTKAYYEACCTSYEKSTSQIAGHLDLVTKFNEKYPVMDPTDPRYLSAALEAADTAISRGLVLEVNTGAISRGYRTTPYPHPAILKYLLERNAPVVVTSDCHDARYLDCHYDETAELLRSIGFKSTLRLRKDGWEEIGL